MPHPPVFTLAELATAADDRAFAAQGVLHLEDIRRMPWAARDWLRGWFATAEAMGAGTLVHTKDVGPTHWCGTGCRPR